MTMYLRNLILFGLGLCAPLFAQPTTQNIAGDWQGILAFSGVELRLLFHFTHQEEGGLSGRMDSIDQGVTGIAIKDIVLNEKGIQLQTPSIGGSFKGTFDHEQGAIEGVWEQAGQSIPLVLKPHVPEPEPEISARAKRDHEKVAGDWSGNLDVQGQTLRLVFRLGLKPNGALKGVLDSPDQGVAGIPISDIMLDQNQLRLKVAAVGGSFQGTLDGQGKVLQGEWQQMGNSLPLKLERPKN